jgi:hypothetical protein
MFLTHLVGAVEDAEGDVLDAWIETLLHMAYEGPFSKYIFHQVFQQPRNNNQVQVSGEDAVLK